jgi:thiamine-phosphate pyrophosphorylase
MARMLNRRNGAPRLPPLIFFTDPARTPDPAAIIARLPFGSAVVYRHFGAADREAVARALRLLTNRRRIKLLIGADARLAQRVGADGIHLPERSAARGPALRRAHSTWLITTAIHRRTHAAGADALVLAPVFPSRSHSAIHSLGARAANAIAKRSALPVYALGGVNAHSAGRLHAFAGLAAIDGLA